MKNILLLVHDDPGEEARLQAALDLTRALSGHLSCIDVVEMPVLVGAGYMMADAELALLEDAREREARNRARLEARLAREDVSWDMKDATGGFVETIREVAGLSDLIVLNTAFADRQPPDMRAVAADLVMSAGQPIVAVPADAHGLDVGGDVLIAWNGSAPAQETLRAATPLLALARSVTLAEFGEIAGPAAEDAAAYLSRHGIHADIQRRPIGGDGVAATLLAACHAMHPAYCLLGAYGHSRLREGLFGGVTRAMLKDSPVPLLIAH